MDSRTILVWFRNDLRLHDNETLVRALDNGNRIVPVYCFDPAHYRITNFGTRKTGAVRASFIRQNVIALRDAFREHGGDLHIVHGQPQDILPELCQTYQIDEVYHHREVAHEETTASEQVETALWKQHINLRHFIGHTLYHKEDLPFPVRDIPDAFSVFRRKSERESIVRPQFEAPSMIKFPAKGILPTDVPSLADLGFSEDEITQADNAEFIGGEHIALERMELLLADPTNVGKESRLSPYVASGALSQNTLYHALIGSKLFAKNKKHLEFHTSKLLWRDYYRFMLKKYGNLFFREAGISDSAPALREDDEMAFQKWKNAETGEPVIDDGMRLLNRTGFIPARVRSILAAYLVDVMGVNWLKGAAWFEEKLIDYNPASNYGNWAHVAGVGSSKKDNKSLDINKILR